MITTCALGELLEVLQEYRENDLWGPCIGWPEYVVYERSFQQWAFDDIFERILLADRCGDLITVEEVIMDYIKDMADILRKFQDDALTNPLSGAHDFDYTEMFKIAIRTAKDILHVIADYYSEV